MSNVFVVQMSCDKHQKLPDASANFSELSAQRQGYNTENVVKAYQIHHERKMKTQIPKKGKKKKKAQGQKCYQEDLSLLLCYSALSITLNQEAHPSLFSGDQKQGAMQDITVDNKQA